MERITRDMSVVDAIAAMSDGNPGAISVLAQVFHGESGGVTGFFRILRLDSLGIYGPRIWMLFKDVCREELGVMLKVLDAFGRGDISQAALDHAIDNRGAGLDLSPYQSAPLAAAVKARTDCYEWDRLRAAGLDPKCPRPFGPTREGSSMCQSGSIASDGTRAYCTCDACF